MAADTFTTQLFTPEEAQKGMAVGCGPDRHGSEGGGRLLGPGREDCWGFTPVSRGWMGIVGLNS